MTMPTRQQMPAFLATCSLLFVAAVLSHEYLNGGVRSHHLLDRPDLPAISNWFGLLILPILGWLLGIRFRHHLISPVGSGLPIGICAGLVCSLIYGGALAMSFELGPSAWTSGLFFGLFVLAAVLPIFRAECIFGFVVGMTFTFGAVLPTLVAVVFAAVSVAVHFVFRALMSAIRSPNRQVRPDNSFKHTP